MDIRPITADEIERYLTVLSRMLGFGVPEGERLELERKRVEVERSLAAFDGDEMVATSGSHSFELTLPGPALVPAAGVTAVSVLTTHRRRGILREMMHRLLSEARDRGEPVAVLLASEGAIYERFGFGRATFSKDLRIDPRIARLRSDFARDRVRVTDGKEADEVVQQVFDHARRAQPGQIGRPDAFWPIINLDRKRNDLYGVFDGPTGEPQGYARYRVDMNWDRGLANHRLHVQELVAVDDEAVRGLWSYLLSVDLVGKLTANWRPVDDPLPWMLTDPRAADVSFQGEMLWLCPLDVAALLGSRRYTTDVDLVLEVRDPFLGVGGTFRLRGGLDGADCEATDASADLVMDLADLGSLCLGGVSAHQLAAAGRIEEVTPGALTRADLAFTTARAPWCNTGF